MSSGFLQALYGSDEFYIESAKLDFALELKRVLASKGMTNADLADALGVSRPMVSKMLRGDANLTIESMVKACRRLQHKLYIHIVRENCSARLFELAQSEPKASGYRVPKLSARERSGGDWAFAANDIHQLERKDEAEPLAA